MATNWNTYPVEVKGGLITNLSPLQQGLNAPGSAKVLVNFEPSVEGGYSKILGYSKWSEEAIPGTGAIQGVISTSEQNAIVVRGGKYYFSEAFGAWTEKLDSSSSVGDRIRHANYNFDGTDKIIIVNGATKPIIFDSVAETIAIDSSASSDVIGAEYVVEFKNHIFFGVGTNIVFTAPFTDDDYAPGNGAGIINVGNGITGLVVFRENLIIFSRDQINILSGNSQSDFQLSSITKKTGCLNGDTIQEVGGDVLYLGPDGVRFLSATDRNDDFALQRASENIQKLITDSTSIEGTWSSLVIRKKAQYRLFKTPQSSSENPRGFLATRFVDQSATGIAWASIEGIPVSCSDSKQYPEEEIIIFANTDDYLYKMESGFSFDGEDIQCRYRSPDWPVTDPRVRKTWYKLTSYIETNADLEITAQIILDNNKADVLQPPPVTISTNTSGTYYFWGFPDAIWNAFIYSDSVDNVFTSNLVGSSYTVSVNLSETSTSASFSIDTLLLEFKENDRR